MSAEFCDRALISEDIPPRCLVVLGVFPSPEAALENAKLAIQEEVSASCCKDHLLWFPRWVQRKDGQYNMQVLRICGRHSISWLVEMCQQRPENQK